MEYWKQVATNYAVAQGGNAVVLGALSETPTLHNWEAIRQALLGGNYANVSYFDDFLGDAIRTEWQPTISTGATIAINAQNGGVIRFATDTDDDDAATMTLGLHWLVSAGYTFFETRFKSNTAITLRAVELGLSDAVSETNGLAFSNHSVAGVTDVATDAAIFGYDTDAAMTAWAVNTVQAGTQQAFAILDSDGVAIAPTLVFHRYGVIVAPDGTAHFYYDGNLVKTVENAVATTAVLTPWITLKSLSGAIKTFDIDYVFVSGTRV